MRKKGIFSQNRLVLKQNFGQVFSKYEHLCLEIGKKFDIKKPLSKLSKTAGKTATRRTPKKTAEANNNLLTTLSLKFLFSPSVQFESHQFSV